MIKPVIQHAVISDRFAIAYIDQCAHAEVDNVQCTPEFIDPMFENSWQDRFEARSGSSGHRKIIVAKYCGIVVGFASFGYSNSRHCVIEVIGVADHYRNQAIGTSLLKTVVADIPEPRESLAVNVPHHFSESLAFFKRVGFEPATKQFRTTPKNSDRLELDLTRG